MTKDAQLDVFAIRSYVLLQMCMSSPSSVLGTLRCLEVCSGSHALDLRQHGNSIVMFNPNS